MQSEVGYEVQSIVSLNRESVVAGSHNVVKVDAGTACNPAFMSSTRHSNYVNTRVRSLKKIDSLRIVLELRRGYLNR